MKPLRILWNACIFLFAVLNIAYSQPGWEWLNPRLGMHDFYAVEVADGQTAYIVGSGGTILKSSDSGETWISLRTDDFIFEPPTWKSVCFSDRDHGVIAGMQGMLGQTRDGGSSWSDMNLGELDLNDVDIAGDLIICVGEHGTVYKNTGGYTWDLKVSHTGKNLNAVTLLDELNGWCVGDSGTILRTTNGGESWVDYSIDSLTSARLSDIKFIDDTTGYIAWMSYDWLKTTDGGNSWFIDTAKLSLRNVNYFPNSAANALYLGDEGRYFMTGNRNLLMKTDDYGEYWIPSYRNDEVYDISGIDMFDDLDGIAVGNSGLIIRTHDGGSSWQQMENMTSFNICGSSFINSQKGWFVGEDGYVLYTEDGGKSFGTFNAGGSDLEAVAVDPVYYNGDYAFAVGSDGSCWMFGMGGIINYVPVSGIFMDIKSDGNGNFLAAGRDGRITAFNGFNYRYPLNYQAGDGDFYGICFAGSDLAFAVGAYGTFAVGQNFGGNTWYWEEIPINAPEIYPEACLFHDVYFINNDIGFIAGDDALLLRTGDGGNSWSHIDLLNIPGGPFKYSSYPCLNEIEFVNDTLGYIFGQDGIILKTEDAGLTWVIDFQGFGYGMDIRTAELTGNHTGYLGGHSGMILKTTTSGIDFRSEIRISEGEMIPGFSSDHYTYLAILPDSSTVPPNITVYGYLIPIDFEILQAENIDGTRAERTAEIIISVPGNLGSKSYYIEFIRDSETRLSSLELSAGDLVPRFDPDINQYTSVIPAGSELPLISAAAVNPNARVDIQQAVATNPLQAEFTASVVVSASEGLSEDTYHITFRRSNSDWEWVSPQPSGNNFADAYRIDEHKAYAIGSNGSFFKTIDGGRTWTARPMNTFSTLQEIYFLNTDTGLIAGSNGTIFTSCNGGLDWIPVNSGTSQTLFDISFINDHVGFICGSNGHILKSVNSGKDWEVLYRNDAFHLHTISFLNETTGVAFGTNNTMLRTMDGGKIWWRFTLDYAYNDFCFINDSTGIAIGRSGYLFKTTDGGIHWKYEEINTTLLPSFTAIRFFSETEGYIMGEYGILKTGDGGETWHEVYDTDEKIGFSSLIKFDESNLNAFGDRGRILVSGDGGETWKEKEVYTSFWRLDFASDSVVYASDYIYNGSSYDSPVFKSRNGGKNWSVVDTIMNAAVYDISFTDSLSGYLVDYFGNVFKTKNGGMEWNSSNLGIYTYCIEMIDDHTGFIGGRNGAIFKTTDDWATWENVNNTGKTTYIADIAFADHLNGVACGQSGTLLTTRDGGNSWTDVPALTTANLERIDYTDPLHINITGGTVFLGSEDGGSTWTSLDLDLSATAFGIAFTDQLTGYICSVQEVLKTENGGRTWVNHYYSSSPTFVSLTENLSGIPHIHGYIGSLLKAVDVVSGAEGLITSHPESVTGVVGDSVRFSISASIGNFTYKWLRNGIEIGDNDKITGTDTPELVIRNIILQDQADYACRVTAGDTAVISRNGYLRVKPLVEIITPNGGEEVFSEVPFIIHYVARKPSAGEISLSVNKGFTWRTIATYVLPDTGAYSFVWTDIPAVSSDYCLLRIADNHYKSSADISDHPFRLHRGANIPEDPSNLEVSNFGMTTVTLDWYDNSDNESGFRLLRTNAATSHTDTIPVEQNRTAWNDSGLDPGTEYLYHIFAFNEYGNSNNSNTVQVVTGQIPGAPSNLSAGEGDDIIVWLKWTDNSDNEEHFVIERRVNSGAWSTIETVLANTVAWSDYVVNAGFNYSYRIKAENRFGESACSAVETVYIESVPEKPLNFRAEVISVSEVRLTWLDVADNEDRYEVYRHGSNDNFTRIATISRNSEVYYDSGLLPGTYYYYRVKVISESGKYTYSDTYGILTGSRPSAPVGFTINQSGADQLRLSWYRGSANTDYYRIDRKMNNGSWVTIMSKTSGTTYTDYGVSAGRTYSYRVFAVNRYDISIPTNALSFTIVPPPSVVKKHKIYARDNKGAYRAGARVYIKSSYQELFTESTYKGTTNPSGYLEVDPLKSGDEILVMLKVDDVPAVKSEHESVDNIMYSVYLDNGEIQSDGTYSFYHHGRTFPVNDEATVINLNHPVILYNLVVCFKNNPDDEFISEFDTCMTNVANILFDATDGHISLNKIAYFDVDDINDYNADIVVTDNRETWPNALVGGIEMKWEPFIIVRHSTVKIGPAIYFNNIYYKPNSLRYSRALTHEIFHYALKLYEEYLDGTGLRSLKIGGNSSFRPYNYSIMDDGWVDIYDRELTNEEMQTEMKYFPSRAVSVSEISSLKEYLPNYSFPRDIDKVTEQYYHNYDGSRRYSAWDWIAYKFSTAHSNLGIQLTKPDYDYYRGTWSYRRPYRPGPYETYFTFMPELPDYKVKGPAKAGGEIVFATLPVNSKVFTENNLNGYFQGLADQFGAISLAKSGEFDDLRFYKIDRHRVLFDTVGNIFNSYDPAPLIANTPPVAPGVLVQNRISESDSLLQCSFLLVTDSSAAGIPVMQEITLSRDPLAVSTLFENVHEAVLLMDEADYYSEPFYLNLSLEDSNGQSWNYLVKNAVKVNLRDRVTVHRIDNAEFVFGENATAADEIILYSSITGIPLHAKSQDLIPISEYYGFSMLSTKALEEPIALNIDYMILPADGIDETSVNMYQWVDESGYWSALRNSTPDMAGDVVSALIDEPGIYALFARLSGTDTIGPGPVTDLNAFPAENSQVLLTWTAPGDDGFQGQAMHYELRYALDEITEINWNSAEPVFGMPVPSPAGSDEQAFVPIIDTMALYCFAVKTTDDAGHVSELSNPAWSAPGISLDREHISITFSDDHEVLNSIFIGKEIHATDHFDYDTDILIPEAGEGLVVYTLCPDNSKLHEDIRSSAAGSITWEVHVEGVAPDYDEIIIEWDPTSLPDDGNYHIAGMDMGKTREFSIYRDSVFDIVFEKYPEGLRIPDRTEEEDFADFHVNINHYFPEEDTLSFFVTIEYGDVGAVIESDSLLIIRSVQDWYGESSILITGLSSAGAEYNQSFNLNILPVNDPPQFTSQPILEASVDSAYFYAITGEDVDEGDSVYIAYDKIPSWLALDPVTWQLSGMPSREDTTGNDVVLKISDGEADALQAFSITVNTATNLRDLSLQGSIRIYPNPTSGKLMVEISEAIKEGIMLEITDPSGKLLSQQMLKMETDNAHVIDISSYPSGLYNFVFKLRDAVQRISVVKE